MDLSATAYVGVAVLMLVLFALGRAILLLILVGVVAAVLWLMPLIDAWLMPLIDAGGLITNMFGVGCGADDVAEEDMLADGVCCQYTANCKDKNTCMYCKGGNSFSLVGATPSGSQSIQDGGYFCGSSRKCGGEKVPTIPSGACISKRLAKHSAGCAKLSSRSSCEKDPVCQWVGSNCWKDGTLCAQGTSCNSCCKSATFWPGKMITACGKEDCWQPGTPCVAGATCSNCCNTSGGFRFACA